MTVTRTCKGCGSVYTLDLSTPDHKWWNETFPEFCSEDCEFYHYHPESN